MSPLRTRSREVTMSLHHGARVARSDPSVRRLDGPALGLRTRAAGTNFSDRELPDDKPPTMATLTGNAPHHTPRHWRHHYG